MPELKEVIALRALADEYEAGSGFEDDFPILREAADTIETLQRELAEREEELVVLRDALHQAFTRTVDPNAHHNTWWQCHYALNDTAPAASAIRAKWRDEAIEETCVRLEQIDPFHGARHAITLRALKGQP